MSINFVNVSYSSKLTYNYKDPPIRNVFNDINNYLTTLKI